MTLATTDTHEAALRGRVARQAAMMGLFPVEIARRLDEAPSVGYLLDDLITEAGHLAGEPDLAGDPPPIGEIVSRLLQWIDPLHPYFDWLDCPFSDGSVEFLKDCAYDISQRGPHARFSERQVDYALSLWRQATQEIRDAIKRMRREARK